MAEFVVVVVVVTITKVNGHTRVDVEDAVDPLLTVGTAWRVPRVDNTDDRQTSAAEQHWTGEPLKHILSSLLSDLLYTTNGAI